MSDRFMVLTAFGASSPRVRHGTVMVRSGPLKPPETCYTRLGDVNVGYQVFGGGLDLIVVPMFASHLDLMWSEPWDRAVSAAASFVLPSHPFRYAGDRRLRSCVADPDAR